jgi:phosphoglycolate phosphatase
VSGPPPPRGRVEAVLLDLDGTLLDPFEGITRCYQHALERLSRPVVDAKALSWCIGPPLRENLRKILETEDAALVERGVALFRERFDAVGWSETRPYPGALEALDALRAAGLRLFLATAKPQVFTDRTVARFGLDRRLEAAHGASLDAALDDKAVLVRRLLKERGVDPARAVMVGDRRHDVRAGLENGLAVLGATWGYGSREELREAGALSLCDAPGDLPAAILGTP